MVWASHIIVSFPIQSFDGVAALAQKHAGHFAGSTSDAKAFLNYASLRGGTPSGPKGGMFLWGWTGNHVDARLFVNELLPFFRELLSGEIDGGPSDDEHVVVIYEEEQSRCSRAFEIANALGDRSNGCAVTEWGPLPFSWGLT